VEKLHSTTDAVDASHLATRGRESSPGPPSHAFSKLATQPLRNTLRNTYPPGQIIRMTTARSIAPKPRSPAHVR